MAYNIEDHSIYKICDRLDRASGSLKGLAGLLCQSSRDICFADGELYGLGQLVGSIADELHFLEDTLRSGRSPNEQ